MSSDSGNDASNGSPGAGAASGLFLDCYAQYRGDQDAVLLCVAQGLEARDEARADDVDRWLLVVCGAVSYPVLA